MEQAASPPNPTLLDILSAASDDTQSEKFAQIRDTLGRYDTPVDQVQWRTATVDRQPDAKVMCLAFIGDQQNNDYVLLMTEGWTIVDKETGAQRCVADDEAAILFYTPAEWDAFVWGAKDGEFNLEDKKPPTPMSRLGSLALRYLPFGRLLRRKQTS